MGLYGISSVKSAPHLGQELMVLPNARRLSGVSGAWQRGLLGMPQGARQSHGYRYEHRSGPLTDIDCLSLFSQVLADRHGSQSYRDHNRRAIP
jgi:hypothetical protein